MLTVNYYNDFFEIGQQKINFSFLINLLNLYPQISCLLKTAYLSAPIYGLPLLSFTLIPPIKYIHTLKYKINSILIIYNKKGIFNSICIICCFIFVNIINKWVDADAKAIASGFGF